MPIYFDIKPTVLITSDSKIATYEKMLGFEENIYCIVELIKELSNNKQGLFYAACNDINPHLKTLKQATKDSKPKKATNIPLASVCVANVFTHLV